LQITSQNGSADCEVQLKVLGNTVQILLYNYPIFFSRNNNKMSLAEKGKEKITTNFKFNTNASEEVPAACNKIFGGSGRKCTFHLLLLFHAIHQPPSVVWFIATLNGLAINGKVVKCLSSFVFKQIHNFLVNLLGITRYK